MVENENNETPNNQENIGQPVSQAVKKSTGKIIAITLVIAFGVVALCGVSAFAYKALSGKSSGSSSPEAVIKNTISKLDDGDLIGAARLLDPSEFDPFIENYDEFTEYLEDEEEIQDEDNPLEAFSFEFKDLETKTIEYSKDVARVELLDGTLTVKTDKSKLPKERRDGVKATEVHDIEKANKEWRSGDSLSFFGDFDEDDLESKNIFYVAVKRDGRWYLSTTYTAAEYLRIVSNALGSDIDKPSFDKDDRKGEGSDSPEEAMENFLTSFDIAGMIERTAPDRFSVGHDYKKILVDVLNNNLNSDYAKEIKDSIEVSKLDTDSKDFGNDRKFISVEEIEVSIDYSLDVKEGDKENFTYYPYKADIEASWDGKCYKAEGTFSIYEKAENYFPTAEFPLTDALGETFDESDFEDSDGYIDTFDLEYPVADAEGKIYPTDASLTNYSEYYPLPWYNADGDVAFDASGNEVEGLFAIEDDLTIEDAQGNEVRGKEGDPTTSDLEASYTEKEESVDEEDCLSSRELKTFPHIGLVTVKEDGKHFISPFDTIWFYVLEFVDNS